MMEVSQYIEQFRQRFNLNDEDYQEAAKDLCEIVLSGSQNVTEMLNGVVGAIQDKVGPSDVVKKGDTSSIVFSAEQCMNLNNNRYFSIKLMIKYSDTTVEEVFANELSRDEYFNKREG